MSKALSISVVPAALSTERKYPARDSPSPSKKATSKPSHSSPRPMAVIRASNRPMPNQLPQAISTASSSLLVPALARAIPTKASRSSSPIKSTPKSPSANTRLTNSPATKAFGAKTSPRTAVSGSTTRPSTGATTKWPKYAAVPFLHKRAANSPSSPSTSTCWPSCSANANAPAPSGTSSTTPSSTPPRPSRNTSAPTASMSMYVPFPAGPDGFQWSRWQLHR